MKPYCPVVRIKKTFDYSADHVFQAACSSLRRADEYRIEEKIRKERTIYLERTGHQSFSPLVQLKFSLSSLICLVVLPLEDGRYELVIRAQKRWGPTCWLDMRDILAEICKWVENDLEIYQYPTVSQH